MPLEEYAGTPPGAMPSSEPKGRADMPVLLSCERRRHKRTVPTTRAPAAAISTDDIVGAGGGCICLKGGKVGQAAATLRGGGDAGGGSHGMAPAYSSFSTLELFFGVFLHLATVR